MFIQGKVAELRLELNSGGKKDKNHSAKKIALKKIVANMTMSNNDMVALFPDVVCKFQSWRSRRCMYEVLYIEAIAVFKIRTGAFFFWSITLA